MRTLSVTCLVAAFLLLAAPSVDAGGWGVEKWTERPSGWAGHGIGSLIHKRTTQSMDIPGMGARKTVTEEKRTLLKITETEYVIKVESLGMTGQWTTRQEKEPKVWKMATKPKITDVGEGSVTIEGKTYACKKKKIDKLLVAGAGVPKGTASPSGVAWVHEKEGVLKMEMTTTTTGAAVTTTHTVEKLSVNKKVGETTIKCRQMKMTNSMMGAGGITMLMSPDVPGGTVRTESKMSRGGMDISTVTELIAYVKK